MNIRIIEAGALKIAVVEDDAPVVADGQSALDLVATIDHVHGARRVILPKSAVCEDFFRLSTGVAGEVAQKFVNYGFRVAVVGDFSGYGSKPLRDYIYECNNGQSLSFVATEAEAVERLSR
ncbi:MAG: DUF4180 domain-containing protein [Clostridiales Family XIII bacterium]|jgi:hypothetical protein|nr:DUF4180 domain-containing protein [Clostridiales Family XIII bacterium]